MDHDSASASDWKAFDLGLGISPQKEPVVFAMYVFLLLILIVAII